METCPCGTNLTYDRCCQPYHAKTANPPTAEALMRSRYSAYVKGEIDYLFKTLVPEKRSPSDIKSAKEWSESAEWLGLEIVRTSGGANDPKAQVEFIAHFRQQGQEQSHHEVGNFKKIGDSWYFAYGKIVPTTAAGATAASNDPCPCGSGKKFKRCCKQR